MSKLKDRVLALLLSQTAVSGEVMAAQLSVTRAAVWKAVQALRSEGVPIEVERSRGYFVPLKADLLCKEALERVLPEVEVQVYDEVDSSNLRARQWAEAAAPHGSLVMAAKQAKGRGRMGRQFESPQGGVYLSIILRPSAEKQGLGLLTAAAAVAVSRVVQEQCDKDLQIKWVNDLYYKGKKCAGILTEGVSSLENGGFEHLICGIGLNYAVASEAFDGALSEIACSLYPQGNAPLPRVQIAAQIYRHFMDLYEALPEKSFLQEYRERNFVPGKRVRVLQGEGYEAMALDIDEDARLLVQLDSGERRSLSSGEVSVRPIDMKERKER